MAVAIVAHRGDSGSAPENTLPAFRRAVELGVEYVELDYHLSADSRMVVIHDAVLDRTTDAAGRRGFGPGVRVRDRDWEQLRQLNAADWPSRRWPEFRPTHIPSLQEALEEIVIRGGCECMIERKPGEAAAEPLCELIREMGVENKVIITSCAAEPDAWVFLNDCLAILDGVRVAYQISGDFYRDPREAKQGQYAACDHAMLSRELFTQLSEQCRLNVLAWTANEMDEIRRLRDIGVEGIITDYPGLAISELRRAERRKPPG
jgi:glycerophosphoryl diester phosphodiesterase